jgi:aryl-alcohol dehydrogenase-like predicted oxidoreductase
VAGTLWLGGSRKYMLASLDESLARMGLEYVDIFYSHRPTVDVPLEETMGALVQAVRQGKACMWAFRRIARNGRAKRHRFEERRSPAADSSAFVFDAESLGGETNSSAHWRNSASAALHSLPWRRDC